ncbi:MAG: hypothetical protein FJY65_00695 [Calditrichaeota bacterium]|nr:hypothetical protein [Calditrichota bacterium]
MELELKDDFKDFLRLLNKHKVKYLIVGGYAVGLQGYVRGTRDMDIWISNEPENAALAAQAIIEFGFNLPEVQPALFEKPNKIIRMGLPPIRLEVFTTILGVNFNECWSERDTFEFEGIIINVISLKDLIISKRSSGRKQDLIDIEKLTLDK